MIVINFSHPLTPEQLCAAEILAGQRVERVLCAPVQFDNGTPFAVQVETLLQGVGLTTEDWQSLPLVIVPPSLNTIALALMANLHGLMGYWPTVLRLRPVVGATPPRFEVAELLNLQEIRDRARKKR